jgi:hypothetical protein
MSIWRAIILEQPLLKYLCIVSSLVHYQTILCFLSNGSPMREMEGDLEYLGELSLINFIVSHMRSDSHENRTTDSPMKRSKSRSKGWRFNSSRVKPQGQDLFFFPISIIFFPNFTFSFFVAQFMAFRLPQQQTSTKSSTTQT